MKYCILLLTILVVPLQSKPHIIHCLKKYTKDNAKAALTYVSAFKYNIDPLLLTTLIWSESRYNSSSDHNLSHVKGMSGINTRFWKIPNKTDREQIEAGAYVLKHYLKKYDNNETKAVTGYKGVSELGRRQARYVISKYKEAKHRCLEGDK